jgi:hypothetical protein
VRQEDDRVRLLANLAPEATVIAALDSMLHPLQQALFVDQITTLAHRQQRIAVLMHLQADTAVGRIAQHVLTGVDEPVSGLLLLLFRGVLVAGSHLGVIVGIARSLAVEAALRVHLNHFIAHKFHLEIQINNLRDIFYQF